MLKRIAAVATAAAAITVGMTLPAHAETGGQYALPRSGRICIEDNGWAFGNVALPELASRIRAQGVANVVVWDECNGTNPTTGKPYHDRGHTIDIVASNSPSENYCARTEYKFYEYINGRWVWEDGKWVWHSDGATWGADIRVNVGIPRCWNTTFAKRHVLSHEVMHAFGGIHSGRTDKVVSNVNGWAYEWPTNQDYRELRSFGFTDLR